MYDYMYIIHTICLYVYIYIYRERERERSLSARPSRPPRIGARLALVAAQGLGGFKGSATQGQFRKCDSTVVFQSTTQQKQGKGVQQGSGIPKSFFFNLTLYHGPLISCRREARSTLSCRALLVRGPGKPRARKQYTVL